MTTSLDHVGRVIDERTGGRSRTAVDDWIARNREAFLAGLELDARVLAAFEVEQECRELVYAARFLPRWRYAPLASLEARFGR
jgi:maltokinase